MLGNLPHQITDARSVMSVRSNAITPVKRATAAGQEPADGVHITLTMCPVSHFGRISPTSHLDGRNYRNGNCYSLPSLAAQHYAQRKATLQIITAAEAAGHARSPR